MRTILQIVSTEMQKKHVCTSKYEQAYKRMLDHLKFNTCSIHLGVHVHVKLILTQSDGKAYDVNYNADDADIRHPIDVLLKEKNIRYVCK